MSTELPPLFGVGDGKWEAGHPNKLELKKWTLLSPFL